MTDKSRAITLFEQYLQSEQTRKQYRFNLDKFVEFYNLENPEAILSLELSELKEKIEDYVISMKNKGRSVGYIRLITFAIQSFCEANDIEGINWKKLRKLVGKKPRPKKVRHFSTDEIKLMLGVTKSLRSKAIILFLSSSGIRRGAIPELKMKHLKEMPDNCMAVTVYGDSDEEYTTFINQECREALVRYFDKRQADGEILNPDHPVFRTKYQLSCAKTKSVSEQTVSDLILRVKINSGVSLHDEPNMLCHAFRRRFNTVLKLNSNANPQLIERLMGHDMKLDNSYFQPSIDDLFTEYQKGISDLTIDDKTRVLEELKVLEHENSELEKKNKRIEHLEKRFENELSDDKFIKKITDKILEDMNNPKRKIADLTTVKGLTDELNRVKELEEQVRKDMESD